MSSEDRVALSSNFFGGATGIRTEPRVDDRLIRIAGAGGPGRTSEFDSLLPVVNGCFVASRPSKIRAVEAQTVLK